jgi:hypothetical protein
MTDATYVGLVRGAPWIREMSMLDIAFAAHDLHARLVTVEPSALVLTNSSGDKRKSTFVFQ